ncbi:MAG: hypothetical protein H8D78_08615, partial [Chloroflexi bacterium]|nr:hypothetical protein [Chloroflexota bacterium]
MKGEDWRPDAVATGRLVPGAVNASSSDHASWDPSAWQSAAAGYCFTCDGPVQIEYYVFWAGSLPPWTCQRCGGHDVAFLDRLSELLLQRIGELERRLA